MINQEVLRMGIDATCAARVRLVVHQQCLRAQEHAVTALAHAQAQIHVAEAYRHRLFEPAHCRKHFALDEQAGGRDRAALARDAPNSEATEAAIVSALAPGKVAMMLMVGKSTDGRAATGSSRYEKAPNTRKDAVISVVITGRRMQVSERFIATRPSSRAAPPWFRW